MNRKTKIIVSITGITLVLLILVGLTYAYFLTIIQGNTNNKSIDVTTKDLALVYRDGTPEILFAEKIIPDNEHSIGTKEFNVTNTGNSETDYIVVIDNIVVKDLTNNPATLSSFESFDFTYTLTCKQYNVTTGLESGTCSSVSTELALPEVDDSILISNKIDAGKRQEYILTVFYKDTGKNQSGDMNKSLEAIVDIRDIKTINPYSSGTLAYNIINNSLLKKNGTELKSVPLTKPASQVSTSDEKELTITIDDDGTSYYFRGNVTDNYVNFAGLCWKIVRIEGDGAIKLILEDSTYECDDANYTGNWSVGSTVQFGSDSSHYADFQNSTGGISDELLSFKTVLAKSIDSSIGDNPTSSVVDDTLSSKLKIDSWCFDHNVTEISGNDEYYGAYTRLNTNKQPSNVCTGTKITKYRDNTDLYVGTLTADEVVFAGAKINSSNTTYYISNSYTQNNTLNWWTLSPYSWSSQYNRDRAFQVIGTGSIYRDFIASSSSYVARPAVTLKVGTTISDGEGTQSKPYLIN